MVKNLKETMKENKLVQILIPIIAVIVIFESVMLVSNLEKESQVVGENIATDSAKSSEVVETPVADLAFATDTTEMTIGKTYEVKLNLVSTDKDIFVDGVETYVKYDPELVTVSKIVSGSEFPKATLSKIDSENGIIKNIILVDDTAGYNLIKDQVNQVLTFKVTPKKEGNISFEITSGNADEKFVTMIVETTTSKSLKFSSNKLEINATK